MQMHAMPYGKGTKTDLIRTFRRSITFQKQNERSQHVENIVACTVIRETPNSNEKMSFTKKLWSTVDLKCNLNETLLFGSNRMNYLSREVNILWSFYTAATTSAILNKIFTYKALCSKI